MRSSAFDGYPGQCNPAAGGGGESAILPALRCQNLAAEIGILNFGLWKKIQEGLCAAVKSLTAIDAHERQRFNELSGTVVSR